MSQIVTIRRFQKLPARYSSSGSTTIPRTCSPSHRRVGCAASSWELDVLDALKQKMSWENSKTRPPCGCCRSSSEGGGPPPPHVPALLFAGAKNYRYPPPARLPQCMLRPHRACWDGHSEALNAGNGQVSSMNERLCAFIIIIIIIIIIICHGSLHRPLKIGCKLQPGGHQKMSH